MDTTEIDGEIIEQIASAIIQRGFGLPALLVLEMHQPLIGLFHAGVLLSSPLLLLLVGREFYSRALKLLQSREAVAMLCDRIGELLQDRKQNVITVSDQP